MLRAVASVFILFAFWVVLSGFFTPFLLGAGVGSAIAVVWLLQRMKAADNESLPMHLASSGVFCVIGPVGLLRMPDFYTRVQGAMRGAQGGQATAAIPA